MGLMCLETTILPNTETDVLLAWRLKSLIFWEHGLLTDLPHENMTSKLMGHLKEARGCYQEGSDLGQSNASEQMCMATFPVLIMKINH